jgi:hypothetical protein
MGLAGLIIAASFFFSATCSSGRYVALMMTATPMRTAPIVMATPGMTMPVVTVTGIVKVAVAPVMRTR